MLRKDIRYYISTINLKSQAAGYDLLDRLSLLEKAKNKNRKLFLKLYDTYFEPSTLSLNYSYSTEYTTYCFFSKAVDLEQHILFDREGVAMCMNDAREVHKNPLLPAYFALACYNDFLLNNDAESLQKFWHQTAHLEKIGEHRNDCFFFNYLDDLPMFEVKAPWFAGITQGLCASVFCRAYFLTQKEVFKKKARQSLETMFIPLEKGGIFCKTIDGFDWIEEYPSVSRRSLVLNGFIFSIIALCEYLVLCEKDEIFENRLQRLIESLFKTFHHYKFGQNLKYSQYSKSFQNISYQGLVICQFLHLYELTNNKAFQELATMLNQNMNWHAYFRLYDMAIPEHFKPFSLKFDNSFILKSINEK